MKERDILLLESFIERYGEDEVLETLGFKKFALAGAMGLATMGGIHTLNRHLENERREQLEQIRLDKIDEINAYNDSLYNRKIEIVDNYMKEKTMYAGRNPERLEISPQKIVDLCDEYKYDLPLLLAQAQIESHFGTDNTKAINIYNSVFSVGCWDNEEPRCKYATQDDSIEPYIKLMIRDYGMSDEDTINRKLSSNNLVNMNGERYASDKAYEKKLRSTRNNIIDKFPELIEPYKTLD